MKFPWKTVTWSGDMLIFRGCSMYNTLFVCNGIHDQAQLLQEFIYGRNATLWERNHISFGCEWNLLGRNPLPLYSGMCCLSVWQWSTLQDVRIFSCLSVSVRQVIPRQLVFLRFWGHILRLVFFCIPDCQLTSLWVPPICAMGGKAELTLMWEPHH